MINLIYTILCILCLCIGFFAGYRINSEKKLQKPHPINSIKQQVEDHKFDKEIQEQLDELNKICENIETYDGTPANQKELKNIEIEL